MARHAAAMRVTSLSDGKQCAVHPSSSSGSMHSWTSRCSATYLTKRSMGIVAVIGWSSLIVVGLGMIRFRDKVDPLIKTSC